MAARRWPSRSATSPASPTCCSRACRRGRCATRSSPCTTARALNYATTRSRAATAARRADRRRCMRAGGATARTGRTTRSCRPRSSDAGRVRCRARRRSQHLRGARSAVRRDPRAQPAHRCPVAVDRGRGACARALRSLDEVLGRGRTARGGPRAGAGRRCSRTGRGARREGLGGVRPPARRARGRGVAVEDTRDGQRWRRLVATGG
jgi:hypothetical protein